MKKLRLALAVATALAAPTLFAQQKSADTSASALHWAAHQSDLGAAKRLLSEGADPNAENRFGVTPLHEAAATGNAAMLKLMLDAGGNANAEFGEGETVLMSAARGGNLEAVEALLAHGGEVDRTERWHGQTALMWAAVENHGDVVKRLIEAGAEVDRTSTQHDWVKISYSEGNVPKTRDFGGLTALHFAARQGSIDAVDALLAAGADVNRVEPQYQLTPLQLAIVNGHYTLAKRLIDRGVNVDDGSLYLAIDTRNLGFYAQRPNPPDKDGEVTNLDVINALLKRGANPNLPYTKGIPERTVAGEIAVPPGANALDRAAAAGDLAVVEALMAHGGDPRIATEDGTTALILLAGYSRQRGAGPNMSDPKRLALIRAMIEKGADVNAAHKDSTNDALYFARERNAPEVIALLEQFGAGKPATKSGQ